MKNQRSFTIIEVLVVITIISLLASIVLITTKGARERAKIAKSLNFAAQVHHALGAYSAGIWDFDENADNTCQGAISPFDDICDSSGNNNHGQRFNATWTTEGDTPSGKGYALSLDGSVSDYVVKNLFNNFPTTEITIAFWMKSSDNSKNGTPISYAASGGSDNEFLIYNYKSFSIFIGAASLGTGISANDGSWHHIVTIWRSSNGDLRLYKDGKEEYSNTLQTGYSIVGNGSFIVGQEQDSVGGGFSSSQAFLGLIDDVRIYEESLSSAQIRKLYVEGAREKDLAVEDDFN